ncbi:TetR/AcrR family transcriptional regulator [Vogesella amnigena]|uniref:TetR/AcrR family transcriptional regulator n=1 Tax=Vogesella amnigena TaxID=1507449 RepID=A0ABV7TXX0_9NEIS
MTTSRPRIKTYDRIVEQSLALFNEHGERNITTNHIASHLGISPGNLYYHFRNKEEIVYQIFLRYHRFITERLAVPQDRSMNVGDLVNYLDTAFEAMWRFRFMFYDLPGLMARNPQLQADYHQFVNSELQTILESHFREFIRLGLLKMELEDIAPVSVNIWLVVKFWFAFEQTARPKAPITEASGHRGVRQVLALLKPYVTPEFLPAFNALQHRHAAE